MELPDIPATKKGLRITFSRSRRYRNGLTKTVPARPLGALKPKPEAKFFKYTPPPSRSLPVLKSLLPPLKTDATPSEITTVIEKLPRERFRQLEPLPNVVPQTDAINPQYDYVSMHSAIRLKPKNAFSHLSVPKVSVKFQNLDRRVNKLKTSTPIPMEISDIENN